MSDAQPGFLARLVLAITTFVRVLFDAAFAARVQRLNAAAGGSSADAPAPQAAPVNTALVNTEPAKAEPASAEPAKAEPASAEPASAEPASAEPAKAEPDPAAALALLALFQREGRFVDFLQQDVASFPDADVGAAARVVHEGCRKALRAHATITPLRSEAEESRVTLEEGYDAAAVKLTGKVGPRPPYRGVLRHAGWRVAGLRLPRAVGGYDAEIVAPAEVEL
ncbi:MAG: DUF2760 domain-containing protein [Deltaproteobacteria bacterium]|nr:DUF2760 domain-containing protein [Deltaproteobacteria bacterium]